MASAKSPFAERENLSAIYPVHNVRYLSDSDPELRPTLTRISQTAGCIGCRIWDNSFATTAYPIPRGSPMQTECTPKLFEFEAVERRKVVAGFDGGDITSNAGAPLLRQADRGLR